MALFTERIEVKKTDVSDEELEQRIREKLGKYMGIADVVDKEVVDVDPLELPTPEEPEGEKE